MDWLKIGIGSLAGGIVAAIITVFLVLHFDKSDSSADSGSGGSPIAKGAVVAFDGTSSCPSGWSVYTLAASRVIVGASSSTGNKDEGGKALTVHKPGTAAGTEATVLVSANLPDHSHQYNDIFYSENKGRANGVSNMTFYDVPGKLGSGNTDADNYGYQISRTTLGSKKTATAFTNLPPFIALTYCVKS